MWLANEMKINLPLELDFTKEANNSEKVARIFRDFYWLKVPGIYWSLTTPRVLGTYYDLHITDICNEIIIISSHGVLYGCPYQ